MIPKRYLVMAVVLVLGLLLVPSPQLAQNSAFDNGKVTPKLQVQLEQAAPDELVTVIVRMTASPNLNAIRGKRSAVFSALRATAARSQAPLVAELHRPDFAGKVGVIHQFWIDNLVLVQATPEVVDRIARRGDVSEVFDNYTFTLPPLPHHDGGPGAESALQTPTRYWDAISHIGVKQVWQTYGFRGAGVRVGGLDTGVDITHPDIAGKMYTDDPADPTYPGGWAEFDANGNIIPGSTPHDSAQHGTHTTGTMIGGNASGYDIGIAPDAMLMHGLVIPGGSGTFAQVAGGMEWIIDPDGNPMTDDGADVVNMSLGATGTFPEMVAPTDNMAAAGVFPSFAIGNSGPGTSTTGSPGNVPSAFGVGATDSLDVIASFSSRGPVTWSSPPYVGTYIKPDIAAPGVLIFSSVPGGNWEGDWDGTSMATPHISGTVALMLQANPTLSVDQVKQLLAQTAIDLGTAGKDNTYGYGEVDAFAAVSAALAGIGHLEGTVYSSAGGTVSGVQVLVTDTGQKVYSDGTGHYSIPMVAGDHDVQFSAFGYDPTTVSVTITADVTSTQDVTLNQLPSGYIAGTVTDAGTGNGIAATVSIRYMGNIVRTTPTDPGTGAYTVTLPVGSYDVIVDPPFPYPRTTHLAVSVAEAMTTTSDFTLSPAQILIVDDDAGSSYETYFEAAVTGAGRSYLVVSTPPTSAEMATFDAVVWFTGNDYTTTLSASDEAALAAYLDGGGRLFITGQDIGYDIHTDSFYGNYLHATYVQDDVGLGALNGNPASPVGVGLSFAIQGGSGANNQAYPSEIDPVSPAMPVFFYDPTVPGSAVAANSVVKNGVISADGITSSGAGAVSIDNGTYKLVYFAFGFEAIADEAMRTTVMDRVLDWLQGYPKIVHTPLGDTEDTSSAYEVSALITSDYFPLDPPTFAVVYDAGNGDATLPLSATGNADEYHAFIPAQSADTDVYYYITAADIDGHTSTHPLGAPAVRHHFRVGADQEPPVVTHVPYSNTNDQQGPYRIAADATDNIGIESVYLMYRKNGGLMHRARMEMEEDGSYAANIPGPSEVGDVYEYAIMAMDESYSGLVTRLPATGFYSFTIVEEFVWDFEADDGGFTENGGIWEWGSPTTGPGAAHSGVNVWATLLGSAYPNYMDATLDVPQITLAADKPYALFSFWHWYDFEPNYDGGNVKISTDGGVTFDVITPVGGYDGTARSGNAGIPGEPCFTGHVGVWEQATFDLSAYSGQSIILRFHAGSDGSVYYPGWYVDDVRLRSSDSDDSPPTISNVQVPASTFDTSGPYTVTATIADLFSGLDAATLFYSTDGGTSWTDIAMAPTGTPSEYGADIPGQPNGTRIQFYLRATDLASNETLDPPGAPASTYEFAILPSADILVMVSATTGASLNDFRAALEANGYQADYWNLASEGSGVLAYLNQYRLVVLDERGSMTTAEQTAYAAFLNSGSLGAKKGFFALGRDLSFYSSTRPFIQEYLRADYVQDDPGYREITGEAGDPIGIGETFVISGSYPDEVQRSTTYPGGTVVYHFTGQAASLSHDEVAGAYEKDNKEWDGVLPDSPKSLDAAAGMKYDAATYRSVYFTFNFDYIQELSRRAAIIDRVVKWTRAPEIVHAPLTDTEDTLSAYVATAQVYSDNLDPSRVKLIYDVGSGDVTQIMAPTGNPNEYAGSIPAQSFGTNVSYYISAANNDGNTSFDPPGAPTDRHTFQVTADVTPPEIVHNPPTYSADLTGPYIIQATVTDNVAVDPSSVKLYWKKNGGALTSVTMTNTSGDEYSASIPGPSVVGDTYEYYILARDLATIPNTGRSPDSGFHSLSIVDFYAWDFEANDGDFSAGGPDWEWGAPTSGPGSAHSGDNVWATKLTGNYSSSSNSTLDTPPLTVPSSHAYAMLSMWQWYHIETNFDGGNVKISTDGGSTWTILTPDIGYNGTARTSNAGIPGEPCFTGTHEAWEPVVFNLTPYRGESVIIRFHFGSDSSVQYAGWYIDDVRIESMDDTEGPTFAAQSIPTGTLDTVGPYTVTTEVRDGLSGVASVALHYSTDGSTWNMLAMSPTGNPDEYSGDIPGQPSGTRVKLYMDATDNATNTTLDPAGAPGTTYEFGIMPSGDYLVILGGSGETDPLDYQTAFATLGRSFDIWNWDDMGIPSIAFLEHYQAVVIDESYYFDAAQQDSLRAWLDRDDGTMQRVFMLGRDLSWGSSARPFMEQYTGAAYVQDNPGWYQLTSTPGDPIGAGETFVISGSYPDELTLSTAWPGAQIVYKYSGPGSASEVFGSPQEAREFYQKYDKEWSDKLWPFAPSGPDSVAAVRFVGPHHASVYFAFNLYYIQEPARRAAILGRALDWLDVAAVGLAANLSSAVITPDIPDELVLRQNYPNPFNPTTRITIGVPAGGTAKVSLKVYNVRGQLVATIFEGTRGPGYHTFAWNGLNQRGQPVSSGVYFARFQSNRTVLTRKMVMLK